MKLVHAADLHLDSPLAGLERYEGAPLDRVRSATRRAFEGLVELAVEEAADVLLLAGDLYDGDWKDYSTGLFFSRGMAKLRQAGIRVVWIRGNHDALSVITKDLKLPENVTELPLDRAGTIVFDELGLAIHGQGFASRAVTEDLASAYPVRRSGLFNVGLLHTSVTGRPGHDPYAPCQLETLVNKGYEYWALGHVHRREVLHERPWVVFPGNLQGRHIRETGPKGATLVLVSDGQVTSVEHRALDVVRWVDRNVDMAEAADGHDVVELCRKAFEEEMVAAQGRLVASRITLAGRSRASAALSREPERWANQVRSAANDLGEGAVWVTEIRHHASDPVDWRALARREDALGELVRALTRAPDDLALTEALKREFDALASLLPDEFRAAGYRVGFEDPDALRQALDKMAHTLLPGLSSDAEP